MDIFKIRVFQRQILLQCQFILKSDQLLKDGQKPWFALQMLLSSAGNVSKALWGQGGRLSDERKPLRDSIDIDDSSPFRTLDMRNNWEHFDERVDKWWDESESHNYIDLNIGIGIKGVKPIDTFRNWDPKNQELVFWGEIFRVGEIIKETERILPQLEVESNKPHWNL